MEIRPGNQMLLFPLPEGWSTGYNPVTNMQYYINNDTQVVQWQRPSGPALITYPSAIKCSRILIKYRAPDPRTWRWNYAMRTKRDAADLISKCYVLVTTNQFSFEEVAFHYSECSSAQQGGDIKWLNVYSASPYFIHFAFNLEIGQVTLPIETSEGFEILYRTA